MSSSKPSIIVTGATSMIGYSLLPQLEAAGYRVHAISRSLRAAEHHRDDGNVTWHVADIADPAQFPRLEAEALIHLGPLWLLPPLLPVLAGSNVRRVIGFGSTSLFGKRNSDNAGEREFVKKLTETEQKIEELGKALGIRWTVFRPTLIYDCKRDKNITQIARLVKRYGFFPVVGGAVGRRQPVHAADLAAACVTCIKHSGTFDKTYNLSGGETLSYREMVSRIFSALGKRPRLVRIPLRMYKLAIWVAAMWLPSKRSLTGEMATRMNVDLCFDHDAATRDFDFRPRKLTLTFETEL